MKRLYFITKTITQIVLYLIEVVGISILLAYFSTFLEAYTTLYNFIERCISFYTIYQILVVVILTNINDIQKDLTLAYVTNLKKILLYKETKSNNIKKDILKNINYQLDHGTFNNDSVLKFYKLIKDNIDKVNEENIKMELINAEHIYELNSLNWRFSFLLRIFK